MTTAAGWLGQSIERVEDAALRTGRGRSIDDPGVRPGTLELIDVDDEPLPANVDPLAALDPAQPVLHEGLGSNVASDRSFRYGDPERAFAIAAQKLRDAARHA